MGSGTKAVAAIQEGRNWIGFEADSIYIQAARKRIKEIKRMY
jgi:DNA modification methylase